MNTRFCDISVLRVVAMLLVVYYHCICPYYIWGNGLDSAGFVVPLYRELSLALVVTHLPTFFLIAGYLFGYKRFRGGYADQRQFLVGKARRVLVPYLTVGLLLIALRQGTPGGMIAGHNSHLWFLVTIFECYAVGKLVDFVLWERTRVKVCAFVAVGACALLAYFCTFVLSGKFTENFLYYFGGMLLASAAPGRLRRWRPLFVTAAVVSLAVMVLVAVLGWPHILHRLCSMVLVSAAFLAFRTSQVGRLPRWVMSLDACSMGIYIVHHIVIQGMNRTDLFHALLRTHYVVYPTVQFVVVLLFSWGVVWALRRYRWSRYFGL